MDTQFSPNVYFTMERIICEYNIHTVQMLHISSVLESVTTHNAQRMQTTCHKHGDQLGNCGGAFSRRFAEQFLVVLFVSLKKPLKSLVFIRVCEAELVMLCGHIAHTSSSPSFPCPCPLQVHQTGLVHFVVSWWSNGSNPRV